MSETERLKEFEKAEYVDVVIEWGDETAVRQKVATDLAARTGRFCIVLAGSDGGVQTYGSGGLLEPLDEYFTKYPQDYLELDDVYANFLDANRMDGTLYALPYYSFGPGMIYRTDLFEKYGVEPPKTMDELYQVLETLKAGLEADGIDDVYPITMRGAPGEEPSLDLLGFVYAYAGYPAWFEGGPITAEEIKATKAQPIFTSDDFAQGFTAFADILQKYGPPGAATHTWVDMMNLYMQGKAAILMPSAINGYAALTFTDNEVVKNNSDFAPSPVGPSGEFVQSFWTFSLGINADCKNKEAAWKVLTFLTGKESQQAFADRVGWPTVTMKSVMHSPSLVERWGEEEIQLNEDAIVNSNPFYFPYIPELVEFMDRIGTSVSTVIAGEQSAEDALSQLQSWATERMLRAGYYR
ncbi:MAG: sugar ABC transporter substrate-binding protein [Chloroflexi bacterium]|nr:sugar ABC transporter substrate-binding protein [Chloroflexota bacterium]